MNSPCGLINLANIRVGVAKQITPWVLELFQLHLYFAFSRVSTT